MATIDFHPFPVLSTDRLTLRQLSVDDQQAVFDLRSDPEINKYLGRAPAKTIADAMQFISLINDNIQHNRSIYWAITLTETKAFAGSIGLFNFSVDNHTCEIGFELLTNYQGQGIMKDAAESVIRYAFRQLGVEIIEARTHSENRQSIKLLERLGFLPSPKTDQQDPDLNTYRRIGPISD
jgi:[ribosomal protein S5]-alanine N-acetyltransferase